MRVENRKEATGPQTFPLPKLHKGKRSLVGILALALFGLAELGCADLISISIRSWMAPN